MSLITKSHFIVCHNCLKKCSRSSEDHYIFLCLLCILVKNYRLLFFRAHVNPNQMWTYSSVDIPSRVSRTERIRIYISECVVCFCILFFIVCVGLLLYLFFHLYNTVTNTHKNIVTLIES